jgi:ABC-type nickel/cobalt efflux system permease component RcnA
MAKQTGVLGLTETIIGLLLGSGISGVLVSTLVSEHSRAAWFGLGAFVLALIVTVWLYHKAWQDEQNRRRDKIQAEEIQRRDDVNTLNNHYRDALETAGDIIAEAQGDQPTREVRKVLQILANNLTTMGQRANRNGGEVGRLFLENSQSVAKKYKELSGDAN